MQPSQRWATVVLAAVACSAAWARVGAQQMDEAKPSWELLPDAGLFAPLLADPETPRFATSLVWAPSEPWGIRIGSASFGGAVGLLRRTSASGESALQVDLSAGVFAHFDMSAVSRDLMNEDYVVGFPIAWRHGRWAVRVTPYHESSHLGDEFAMRTQRRRVDVSYEAVELLGAVELGSVRLYGGGAYVVDLRPTDYPRTRVQGGIELRHGICEACRARGADLRLIAAADARYMHHDVVNGFAGGGFAGSGRLGFDVGRARDDGRGPRLGATIEAFSGRALFGQFVDRRIRYFGVGAMITP